MTNLALTVGCRWCHAKPGAPCINRECGQRPLGHNLTHICRQKDAQLEQESLPF